MKSNASNATNVGCLSRSIAREKRNVCSNLAPLDPAVMLTSQTCQQKYHPVYDKKLESGAHKPQKGYPGLSMTKRSKNHTLSSGSSPGTPPPSPGVVLRNLARARVLVWTDFRQSPCFPGRPSLWSKSPLK